MSCAQIRVSGSGSGNPGPLVKIPDAYDLDDPAFNFNTYNGPETIRTGSARQYGMVVTATAATAMATATVMPARICMASVVVMAGVVTLAVLRGHIGLPMSGTRSASKHHGDTLESHRLMLISHSRLYVAS
jgi:hypothetical protein